MQKVKTELDLNTILETAYFKSLDDNFKVGLTIYVENTRKENLTTLNYLAQVLSDYLNKRKIVRATKVLFDWGLIEDPTVRFCEPIPGHTAPIYVLTSVGKGQFEQNCKEIMKEIRKMSRDVRRFKRDLGEVQTRKNREMRGEEPEDGYRLGDLTESLATPDKSGKSPMEEAIDEMYKDSSLSSKKKS